MVARSHQAGSPSTATDIKYRIGQSVAQRQGNGQNEQELRSAPMDELDRRLIAELQQDPRLPFSTLGAKLGVTGMTAANRLQRLRAANLVNLRVVPVLPACGLQTEVLGLIQAEVSGLSACISLLRASPNVLRVEKVTGEYDISFQAAFASEAAMGSLVRDLQAIAGVRRLVVHHRLETLKDDAGWGAVWADEEEPPDEIYDLAPTVDVPPRIQPLVATAAAWLQALIHGDTETLRQLSEPDIVFTIMPPYPEAGTFNGFDEVNAESQRAAKAYRQLWHRIIAVSEASEPNTIVIDALNTAERQKGQIRSSFARMAFVFKGNKVSRVVSMGQMDLPDVEEHAGTLVSQSSQG